MTQRTVLVVHPGALGDVLLARRALTGFRAGFPSHAVGVIMRRDAGELLRACGEFAEVFPIESNALSGLIAGPEAVPSGLAAWLSRCDAAVCWTEESGNLRATFAQFGVASVTIRSPFADDGHGHQSNRFAGTIGSHAPVPAEAPALNLPESFVQEGRRRLAEAGLAGGPIAVIHPGSGSPHKCISPMILARVIGGLRVREVQPVLVLGPADEGAGQALIKHCAGSFPVLSGLDLGALAGILTRADLFIGHDSGVTHLAGALAVPSVALFGPTDPARWAPQAPATVAVTGPPCRCANWEAVRACADKPCLRISPETILAHCGQLLEARHSLPCSPG